MATQSYSPRQEKQAYAGTTMLMIGSCIGASLLTLGNRFSNLGWPLATVYMTISITFSFWGYRQIINGCMYTRYTTIRSLIEVSWNKITANIVSIATMLLIFGFLVTYCVIASDYVHSIYDFFSNNPKCLQPPVYDKDLCDKYIACLAHASKVDKIIRAIMGCVVFMLLSFISSIGILSMISTISLMMVLFSICVILGRCLQALITGSLAYSNGIWARREPTIPYIPKVRSILVDFPSYLSLYTITSTIPSLYAEMKGSISEKTKIIHRTSIYATIILIIIYMLLAYVCSATFYGVNQPNFNEDNILNNFSTRDKLVLAVRILYVIVICTAFVCCLFPCRAIFLDLIKVDKSTKRGKAMFFITGAVMVLVLTALAIFVPSITLVFDIVTAIFGFVLYLILPILVGMKVPVLKARREYMEARRASMNRKDPDAELKQVDVLESKIRDRTNSIAAFLSIFGPGSSERIQRVSESMVRRMSTISRRMSTNGRTERSSSSWGRRLSSQRNTHVPFTDAPSTVPEDTISIIANVSPLNSTATGDIKSNVNMHTHGGEHYQESTETETEEENNAGVLANVVGASIAIDHSHVISDDVLLEGFVPPKVSIQRSVTLWTITTVFFMINATSFVITIIGLFSQKTNVCT